jgi:hypothetical protein
MNTVQAYKIETTVDEGGTLVLHSLPFRTGERVEITIQPAQTAPLSGRGPYSLQGTPYRFDDPIEPVASGDWEAVR